MSYWDSKHKSFNESFAHSIAFGSVAYSPWVRLAEQYQIPLLMFTMKTIPSHSVPKVFGFFVVVVALFCFVLFLDLVFSTSLCPISIH